MAATAGVAERLRATFRSGRSRPLAWRHGQLQALVSMLRQGSQALTQAMHEDLGKPAVEAWLTDVAAVRKDVEVAEDHIDRWAAPRRVPVPWALQPAKAEVVPEPLGVALIIGPWNYPVRCLALPLAAALAAGNTVALKPSELAPATSSALARLVGEYLDPEAVTVVEGGPQVAQGLLGQRWDHIFFTGGGRVGRLVMQAAAAHLTPVTLELGGKNPALVTDQADIAAAARRIVWGRFLNAGQTCAAPDFVLVDEHAKERLVEALARRVREFYGAGPAHSADFGRVVNEAHVDRLMALLGRTAGKVVTGGEVDRAHRYLAPTIVSDVAWDDALMEDEIFGPVLPVVSYRALAEALEELAGRDKPLALYVYTNNKAQADEVIAGTSSGTVCVNHNAVQLAVPGLPFGGVGASGMGAYNGRTGFDTFSHLKGVLRKPARGEVALMYPPYTPAKTAALRAVLR